MNAESDQKVWRYMSFGRFVWMLKKKALWMGRADLLGDRWEMAASETAIDAAIEPFMRTKESLRKHLREQIAGYLRADRMYTYVNCWTASDNESHAMWNIYCRSNEGIAVQTTLDKLRESVGDRCQLLKVEYTTDRSVSDMMSYEGLVRFKRPEFAYEREHRIVCIRSGRRHRITGRIPATAIASEQVAVGFPLPWHPEQYVERIWIHPGADAATIEAVIAVVESLAPVLVGQIDQSVMAKQPPL
jgi:hypothetical protein